MRRSEPPPRLRVPREFRETLSGAADGHALGGSTNEVAGTFLCSVAGEWLLTKRLGARPLAARVVATMFNHQRVSAMKNLRARWWNHANSCRRAGLHAETKKKSLAGNRHSRGTAVMAHWHAQPALRSLLDEVVEAVKSECRAADGEQNSTGSANNRANHYCGAADDH